MRTLIPLALIIFSCLQSNAQEMAIIGKWRNSENSHIVEIFKSKDTFSAKTLKSKDNKGINQIVIWGLKYDKEEKQWNKGEIKLTDMNHSANCYIYLKNDSTAVIIGYHGLKILGHSETYFKAESK
jgi:uncharacterized protein (DUF2147 family)